MRSTQRGIIILHPVKSTQRGRCERARGQSMVEYAGLVVVVAASLVAMSIYLMRASSGRLRANADAIGEQYHPRQTTSNFTLTVQSTTKNESKLLLDQSLPDGTKANVIEHTTTTVNDTSNKTGTETVGQMGSSVWQ